MRKQGARAPGSHGWRLYWGVCLTFDGRNISSSLVSRRGSSQTLPQRKCTYTYQLNEVKLYTVYGPLKRAMA